MADGLNIPSGEGLLGEQQQTAAAIPYKNIDAAENTMKGVMNTFMQAQQIGNNRRKLEQQLQMSYMKNDLDERKFGMQMDNMATRHALDIQRLGLQAMNAENAANRTATLNEMAVRGMQVREATFGLAKDKYDDRANDTENATNAVADLYKRDKPGSKTWNSNLLSALAPYPNLPTSTKNKILSPGFSQHNDNINTQIKALNAQESSLRNRWSLDFYGKPGHGDVSVLTEPDLKTSAWVVPEYKTKGGGSAVKGATVDIRGNPIEFVHNPDGSLVAANTVSLKQPRADDPTKFDFKPTAIQRINQYKRELLDINNQRKQLGTPVNDPELGVYSNPANTLPERARRVYNDPNAPSKSKAKAELYLRQQGLL